MNTLERAIRLLAQKCLQSQKGKRIYDGEYEAVIMLLQYLCACPGNCVLQKNLDVPVNYKGIEIVRITAQNRYVTNGRAKRYVCFHVKTFLGCAHLYWLDVGGLQIYLQYL